ncbi:MAG TPA: hypothetical protein VG102_02725 [Candidatus Paceibacterota bacterium]|jgi:hypothetical protein|nr:hypothetical protein [Candidatus Paceibacterota bacterium]
MRWLINLDPEQFPRGAHVETTAVDPAADVHGLDGNTVWNHEDGYYGEPLGPTLNLGNLRWPIRDD